MSHNPSSYCILQKEYALHPAAKHDGVELWTCWEKETLQALWGSRETKNIRLSHCPQDPGWHYSFDNIIKNTRQKK